MNRIELAITRTASQATPLDLDTAALPVATPWAVAGVVVGAAALGYQVGYNLGSDLESELEAELATPDDLARGAGSDDLLATRAALVKI